MPLALVFVFGNLFMDVQETTAHCLPNSPAFWCIYIHSRDDHMGFRYFYSQLGRPRRRHASPLLLSPV